MNVRYLVVPFLFIAGVTINLTAQVVSKKPDQIVQSYLKKYSIPGASVVVVKNERVIYEGFFGYSDLKKGTKIKKGDLLELGSMGKQFTADLARILERQGYVQLTDLLTKYFPDIPSAWHQVNLQHLLDHTSGIKNYLGDPRFRAADLFQTGIEDTSVTNFFKYLSIQEKLYMFRELPIEFTTGTQWAYSNTGYILLGAVIEKAMGKNFFEVLREKLFNPVGMNQTMENEIADDQGLLSKGYFIKEGNHIEAHRLRSNYAFSAGSIASNTADLAKYMKAVHQGRWPTDSLDSQWRNTPTEKGFPFLYKDGRFYTTCQGKKILFHQGGTPGFSSSWMYVVEDTISVCVQANLQDISFVDHLAWDILVYFNPSLKNTRTKNITPSESKKGRIILESFLNSLKNNQRFDSTLFTQGMSAFMNSENGRGLWNWVFQSGYPEKILLRSAENDGPFRICKFDLPLGNKINYRVTAFFNKEDKLARILWW